MAGEQGYYLTEELYREILWLSKRGRQLMRFHQGKGNGSRTTGPVAQHIGWVQATGDLDSTRQRYPGQCAVAIEDGADPGVMETINDPGDVWVRAANGSVLTKGIWYLARMEENATDEVPCYLVDDGSGPAAGAGSTLAAAVVISSASVTTTTGAPFTVTWDGVEGDDGGFASEDDQTLLTAPADGWYLVGALIQWTGDPGDGTTVDILTSGDITVNSLARSQGGDTCVTISGLIKLTAGDTCWVVVEQESGDDLDLDNQYCRFWMTRVG